MIRTLLATTALSAALITGALAQDATAPATQDPAASTAPAKTNSGSPFFSSEAPAAQGTGGYFSADEGQILASGLIGEKIYTSPADDAETIGDVNDVVIGANGAAEAVVVGVGGFLGIGEKHVAVDFDKLSWVDRDGDRWLVMQTTKEELEAAPEFDRTAFLPDQPATNDTAMNAPAGTAAPDATMTAPGTAPAGDVAATAPAEAPAASTDMAQAPAAQTPATGSDATGAVTPTDPNAPPAASPREGWTVVETGSLSADNMIGTRVYGANDADLGEINDVIVSADGKFEAFIVDVGGFLGVGEKPIALGASDLEIMKNEDGDLRIFSAYTEEQLKTQTAYSEDAYKTDPNAVILR